MVCEVEKREVGTDVTGLQSGCGLRMLVAELRSRVLVAVWRVECGPGGQSRHNL